MANKNLFEAVEAKIIAEKRVAALWSKLGNRFELAEGVDEKAAAEMLSTDPMAERLLKALELVRMTKNTKVVIRQIWKNGTWRQDPNDLLLLLAVHDDKGAMLVAPDSEFILAIKAEVREIEVYMWDLRRC